MKRRVALLLALVLLLPGLMAPGLYGAKAIDSGPFPCDGTQRLWTWANPSLGPIYLRSATLWAGMDKGGIADYSGSVNRASDNVPIIHFFWDHYGNPNGPHTVWHSFSPDYVLLLPGEKVILRSWCKQVGGDRRPHGHHVVHLWWSQVP